MKRAAAVEEIEVDLVPEAVEHLVAHSAIVADLVVDLEVAIDLHDATLATEEDHPAADSVIEVARPEADAARVDTKDATMAVLVAEAVKEGVGVGMVETGDKCDSGRRW